MKGVEAERQVVAGELIRSHIMKHLNEHFIAGTLL